MRKILSIFAFFMLISVEVKAENKHECLSCEKDFAIYNPESTTSPDGVWDDEVTALRALLDIFHWSYTNIDHTAINQGKLGVGGAKKFRALIAPGGLAYYRAVAVDAQGNNNIREFVKSGGNFIGFCAGAYWASEKVSTAINASEAGGTIIGKDDYSTYNYDLKLFPGTAQGPLGWMPWKNGTNYNFDIAEIDTNNPTMKAIGMPKATRFLYGGGPFFTNIGKQISNMEVWARANPPPGAQKDLIGAHEPTIVRFRLGEGNVILFGYHPDVLVKNDLDRMSINSPISENIITWAQGDQSFDDINLQSLNIVHAALQISKNETVTPIKQWP